MTGRVLYIFLLFCLIGTAGCGPTVSLLHQDASKILITVKQEGAQNLLPNEFGSLNDTFNKGEALILEDEVEDADHYFDLAIQKGALLRENLAAEKKRLASEENIRREEAVKKEKERIESEEKRRIKEEAEARVWAEQQRRLEDEERLNEQQKAAAKDKSQLTQYTVKRGETLPQIAAHPDVYGDSNLWPLLYKANRDQIRDPRTIWPGQTLRIPRFMSKEEIQEAKRQAQEKRLH